MRSIAPEVGGQTDPTAEVETPIGIDALGINDFRLVCRHALRHEDHVEGTAPASTPAAVESSARRRRRQTIPAQRQQAPDEGGFLAVVAFAVGDGATVQREGEALGAAAAAAGLAAERLQGLGGVVRQGLGLGGQFLVGPLAGPIAAPAGLFAVAPMAGKAVVVGVEFKANASPVMTSASCHLAWFRCGRRGPIAIEGPAVELPLQDG